MVWLTQFKVMEMSESDELLLNMAESYSDGVALKWLQVMRLEGLETWELLKLELCKRFGNKKMSDNFGFNKLLVVGPKGDIRD